MSKVIEKNCNINNRTYLGNKYKLLNFIKNVVEENCDNVKSIADIFSGTGSVASAFQNLTIYTNDILYSNYICNYAWFSSDNFDKAKIKTIINEYNLLHKKTKNYMTENFANTYFGFEDCSKIGFIREDIENKYKNGVINTRERAILICSLIYAMDKIANTCGHYDAFIHGTKFKNKLFLSYPNVYENNQQRNMCFNMDSNVLIKQINPDLIYIDPPYNSRQYCDAYHLLENVALWNKPEVKGIARKMDRSNLKSEYCSANATKCFEDLINNARSKYIILSYNNMGKKGNDRSNAKISDSDIMRILSNKGTVKVFNENYKAFTAGKSDIKNNEERLFLCICKKEKPL